MNIQNTCAFRCSPASSNSTSSSPNSVSLTSSSSYLSSYTPQMSVTTFQCCACATASSKPIPSLTASGTAPACSNIPIVPPGTTFYKRQLPDTVTAFTSPEGVSIFTEALSCGGLTNYFALSEQYTTQSEPAFCGLASLVMVLNALQMDPGRTWKLPWRWYAEDMLDCCVSLDSIRKEGITLAQFFCLSKCNGLDVKGRYGTDVTLDEFEADVQRACSEAGTMMVASFDRATFRSTGNGHFSPIAGYNPNRRMVLILDTARFKHSAHWAPIDLLYKAMFPVDPKTGQSRGYALLRKSERPSIQCLAGGCKSPEYLFQMNCERHDVAPRAITAFLCDGLPQLAQRLFDSELLQSDSLNHFLGLLVDHAPSDLISVLNVQHSCNSEKFAALIGEIRDLQLYAHVRYTVSQLYASAPLFEVARRDHMDVDACAIVLTTVLLAASVDAAAMNEVGAWARLTELRNEVEQRSAALRAEVSRLQQYFVALAKLHAAEQSALRSEAR